MGICFVTFKSTIFRDLKIEVFRHFPRTANVKKSRDQVLAVRFAVWGLTLIRLDHAPEVSNLPQRFFTLKPHNPTFKKKNHFLELFFLLIIEFYFKKRNFEDNFSAKIEVLKWMN